MYRNTQLRGEWRGDVEHEDQIPVRLYPSPNSPPVVPLPFSLPDRARLQWEHFAVAYLDLELVRVVSGSEEALAGIFDPGCPIYKTGKILCEDVSTMPCSALIHALCHCFVFKLAVSRVVSSLRF
jgi:hypothetical protein